jgi:hypothetical protein
MKTSNKNCRTLVQNRQAFTASNIFAEYITNNADGSPVDPCRYVVYSYGKHFPMYIYEGGHWYANEDKYSRSTSRHQSQANPCLGQSTPMPMTTAAMQTLVRYGIAGLAAKGAGQ